MKFKKSRVERHAQRHAAKLAADAASDAANKAKSNEQKQFAAAHPVLSGRVPVVAYVPPR